MKLTQLEATLIMSKMVEALEFGADVVDEKEHDDIPYHILFTSQDELDYYNE